MDALTPLSRLAATACPPPGFEVLQPSRLHLPLVLASPHSGHDYPPEFLAASRLELAALRRSEDAFVDRIFAGGPQLGAPLLRALFPRAFVDANREPFELDPEMYEDDLPPYANTRSPRVVAGLGTIARTVANGEPIYRLRLPVAEALRRVESFHLPYHAELRRLVDATLAHYGYCLLLDCHSMPSAGGNRGERIDFVLGDLQGAACARVVTATAERVLTRLGYTVVRNIPYAGGYTTRHYGRPHAGLHALQIEINRALYMDEARIECGGYLPQLARDMSKLVAALAAIPRRLLTT
jgi:N-formylglutamate amidohydrolase